MNGVLHSKLWGGHPTNISRPGYSKVTISEISP